MAKNDYLRTSSLDIYGSVKYGKITEKDRYNRFLLGKATKAEIGDRTAGSTLASPPTWTQSAAGLSHAFVISALSSSMHENSTLNYMNSGTHALETTAVPGSSLMYYSKRTRDFERKIYAVTASADIGTSFVAASGSRIGGSSLPSSPYSIAITVPDYGKIIDISVWVELLTSSGSQDTGSLLYTPFEPLNSLQIGIRSPNVKFFSSEPIFNDRTISSVAGRGAGTINNCFLLWKGSFHQSASYPPVWCRDRHMRTVFTDSAHVLDGYNPYHLNYMIQGPFDTTQPPFQFTTNYALNSPNGSKVQGNDKPWISDSRVQQGGSYGAAGSPPVGWLTGPGGTANTNEFNTTGSNYGPTSMRPVYPLLDSIYVRKTKAAVGLSELYAQSGSTYARDPRFDTYKGYRQGLRGTEINGKWEFLIANAGRFDTVGEYFDGVDVYFRQVRLEIIFERNIPGRSGRANKTNNSGRKVSSRDTIYAVITGSNTISSNDPSNFNIGDRFWNIVYSVPPIVANTTVGITDDPQSLSIGNFAVFTRPTGTLMDLYETAGHEHAKFMYLNNEFGTPYVPISSGSESISQDLDQVENTKEQISNVLKPNLLVGKATDIRASVNKIRPPMKSRDRLLMTITGSST